MNRSLLLFAAAAVVLLPSGCTLLTAFEECQADSDCAGDSLCTRDGICQDLCGHPEPPIGEDSVVLGAIQTLDSRYTSETIASHKDAIRLAVERINASGGLGDRVLSVVSCDGGITSKRTLAAAEFLVEHHGVPAILGLESSDSFHTLQSLSAKRKLVLMSHWATARSISEMNRIGDTTLTWRTTQHDGEQGKALAAIAKDACYERIAVVSTDSAYGQGLLTDFSGEFCPGGNIDCLAAIETLPDPYDPTSAPAAYDALVGVLQAVDPPPDAILILGFSDHGGQFVDALTRASWERPLIVAEDLLVPDLVEADATKALRGPIFGANAGLLRGRAYPSFASELRIRANRDARRFPFAAQAFDSAYLLALSIASVPAGQRVTGPALAAGLTRLSNPEGERVRWTNFADGAVALASDPEAAIDFVGASGDLTMDPTTGDPEPVPLGPLLAAEGKVCAATDLDRMCLDGAARCRNGCELPDPPISHDASPAPLVIGSMMTRSGDSGDASRSLVRALDLALADPALGSLGRQISVVHCDFEYNPALARILTTEVIEAHGASALVGPTSSGGVVAVAEIVVSGDAVIISPSATSPTLASTGIRPGKPKLIWRTAPNDTQQGEVLAGLVREQSCVNSLAILARQDDYGLRLQDIFIGTACPELPCAIKTYPRGLPDQAEDDAAFDAIVTWLQTVHEGGPPDAGLFLGFSGEGLSLLRALKRGGLALPMLASETMITPEVAEKTEVKEHGIPIIGASPGLSEGPAYAQFDLAFRAANPDFGPPAPFSAHTFDAVYLLALAAATVPADEAPTGTVLAAALARMSGQAARAVRPADFAFGVTTLQAGQEIDFVGASGELDFDAETGEAPGSPDWFAVSGGSVLRAVDWKANEGGERRCISKAFGLAQACPEDGAAPICDP